MIYKYETHLHTSEGSRCGSSSGKDYIKPYFEAGYSGIFVTDHFFGGNTAAPYDGSWENRINVYCSGYETALKAATEFNTENKLTGTDREFKVFFGIEQTFEGDDYLIYGLSKDWLLKHPEIETMNHKEIFDAVKKENGLFIQAHPFRLRDYIQAIHLHPRDVHGVEIYNAGNKDEENDLAALYAAKYNFPETSGSDIHNTEKLTGKQGLPCGGMAFATPLKDVFDYATRVINKNYTLIK